MSQWTAGISRIDESGVVACLVCALAQPHEEVVGLDVAVDEALAVDILYARYLQQHNGLFVTRSRIKHGGQK